MRCVKRTFAPDDGSGQVLDAQRVLRMRCNASAVSWDEWPIEQLDIHKEPIARMQ
jgi:hypothetical protein